MVQVLPYVPSFGEKLAGVLSQAGTNIAEGFTKRNQAINDQNILKVINDPNASPTQKLAAIQKGSPNLQKIYSGAGGRILQEEQKQFQAKTQAMALAPEAVAALEGAEEPKTGETVAEAEMEEQKAPPSKKLRLSQIPEEDLAALSGNPIYGAGAKAEIDRRAKVAPIEQNIRQSYEASKVSEANVNKMAQLREKKDLIHPLGTYLSNLFGVPVSLVSGADTEEYLKLVAQRGLQVGAAYGFGRILDKEFQNFLRTIPDLLNSEAGKERIEHTLRYFDNLAKGRYKAYREVLRENHGVAPSDLENRILDKMENVYSKASDVLLYGGESIAVKDKAGVPGRILKKHLKEAEKHGFQALTEEEFDKLRSEGF